MPLTSDEVRKVALLARLELTDIEIESQSTALNNLLEHINVLQSADINLVSPTSHSVPVVNVLRMDSIISSLERSVALSNAPEARDGCFLVPRIMDGDA